MFRASGLTAVAVASANNYTAVFLGTTTGRLLKVSVLALRELPGEAHRGSESLCFLQFSLWASTVACHGGRDWPE